MNKRKVDSEPDHRTEKRWTASSTVKQIAGSPSALTIVSSQLNSQPSARRQEPPERGFIEMRIRIPPASEKPGIAPSRRPDATGRMSQRVGQLASISWRSIFAAFEPVMLIDRSRPPSRPWRLDEQVELGVENLDNGELRAARGEYLAPPVVPASLPRMGDSRPTATCRSRTRERPAERLAQRAPNDRSGSSA